MTRPMIAVPNDFKDANTEDKIEFRRQTELFGVDVMWGQTDIDKLALVQENNLEDARRRIVGNLIREIALQAYPILDYQQIFLDGPIPKERIRVELLVPTINTRRNRMAFSNKLEAVEKSLDSYAEYMYGEYAAYMKKNGDNASDHHYATLRHIIHTLRYFIEELDVTVNRLVEVNLDSKRP